MDVPGLLEAAFLLVPKAVATANDVTVNDVWEYLVRDEWEVALDLLEELGDGHPLPLSFWRQLADAAEQMRLERSAAWCRWRCSEIRNGVVRADLTLRPAAEARRTKSIDNAGALRPMWDIGHRSPDGDRAVSIGGLWVEAIARTGARRAGHGEDVPLTPSHWAHAEVGRRITMHEDKYGPCE